MFGIKVPIQVPSYTYNNSKNKLSYLSLGFVTGLLGRKLSKKITVKSINLCRIIGSKV